MALYQIIVESWRRGFWGPKRTTVLNISGDDPEPLLAAASQYNDERYSVIFRDFTGQYPPPAVADPVAVREGDKLDPELEQEWAEQMGWIDEANRAGGHGQTLPF